MNAFFNGKFSSCPLTWVFCKINRMHEKRFRIVYNDNTSSYDELLEIDYSVSVLHRNIQILATELYKIVNRLSTDIFNDVFPLNDNLSYYTRNRRKFYSRSIRSVAFEALSPFAPKMWELVSTHMTSLQSFAFLKSAIKKWKTSNCPWRLCRTYNFQVGFV